MKLLQETYLGQIKMIYIDPPYNTGNDFVYEDNFAMDTSAYVENSGQFDDNGNRLVKNIESNCYFNSMNLAIDNGIRSIAFPSISTGVYSFPVELAAKIAVHTVNRFLQDNPDSFDLVEWVLFDTHTESVYEAEVDQLYKMI